MNHRIKEAVMAFVVEAGAWVLTIGMFVGLFRLLAFIF